jgi:hypothetical protein
MQRLREIRSRRPGALLVFSIFAVQYVINLAASAGLEEGQMRELIGNLAACGGAEQAIARTAVSQQFQCQRSLRKQSQRKKDRADRAPVGDAPMGTNIAFGRTPRSGRGE